MPNINKIKLSGTSYDIQDSNATKTVTLTQAEYDALVNKDPNTFYIISDGETFDPSQYWTSAQTQSAITQATSGITERIGEDEEVTAAALNVLNESLSGKQDTLVSSTNIKTINNESILGSGNINIQGGSTYTAGRGISIANDTISFSLPISAGTGTASIVEGGNSTRATGSQSHAEGYSTSATSQGAHSEGMYSKASNTAAHAEGSNTIASAFGSHAEGYYTTAKGSTSHAEGSGTTASGKSSHAEGYQATASGSYSHAEGQSTSATSYSSHAEGSGTKASGESSHAEGDSTTASGYASHAEGSHTETNNYAEHASGYYNVSSSGSTALGHSGNTLFSVGNGASPSSRHNAFEIRQNGDIYLSSGGTDIKLQDHLGGGGTVDQTIISGSTNAVAGGAVYDKFDEVEQVTARALNDVHESLSGKADTSAVTEVQDSLSGYVATSAVTSAVTSGSTSVITSGGVYEQIGGLKLLKLTQLQYDDLVTKDSNTLYVIVN